MRIREINDDSQESAFHKQASVMYLFLLHQ